MHLSHPERGALAGLRVMIAEDDYFLADSMAQALHEGGAEVIGPVASCDDGLMTFVSGGRIDIAVLDVGLQGGKVFPLADVLIENGVRVLLATAYDRALLPTRYRDVPYVQKPFHAGKLARALPEFAKRHTPMTWRCRRCGLEVVSRAVGPQVDDGGCYFTCRGCTGRNDLISVGVGSVRDPVQLVQPDS